MANTKNYNLESSYQNINIGYSNKHGVDYTFMKRDDLFSMSNVPPLYIISSHVRRTCISVGIVLSTNEKIVKVDIVRFKCTTNTQLPDGVILRVKSIFNKVVPRSTKIKIDEFDVELPLTTLSGDHIFDLGPREIRQDVLQVWGDELQSRIMLAL